MARNKGSFGLAGAVEPKAAAPLDARAVVKNMEELTAVGSFPYPYIGMETYVVSEGKKYRLIGNDPTVSANWEEVGAGIEYTAGDGINIDQNNEISTDRMESSEIDDLDIDTPGQPSGMVIDLDGNELVVGTVIQNGVRKALYQKTVDCGALPNATTKRVAHNISGLSNVIGISGFWVEGSSWGNIPFIDVQKANASSNYSINAYVINSNIEIVTTANYSSSQGYITLKYTKS